jgi:hypothetical protein
LVLFGADSSFRSFTLLIVEGSSLLLVEALSGFLESSILSVLCQLPWFQGLMRLLKCCHPTVIGVLIALSEITFKWNSQDLKFIHSYNRPTLSLLPSSGGPPMSDKSLSRDPDPLQVTPKKGALGKLKLAASLVSKSKNFVSKLRSCCASDLLQESYDTVAELIAGSSYVTATFRNSFLSLAHLLSYYVSHSRRHSQESTCESSRRRTDDFIFANFSPPGNENHATNNARISRIRRDMAARMRAVNSLTHRSRHDSDAAKDAKIEHEIPQNGDESQRIEIPFIETRHPEEEAQLLASRSRMAALQTDIQAANKAREDACIFDLWTAFQELHLNLAVRRHKGSRRRTLLQLGMMVRLPLH